MTDAPLYRSEAEIARAVLGPGHLDEWRALAVIFKREGMPYEIDPMTGKYYWRKIETWLDVWNRVDRIAAAPPRRQGREAWPTRLEHRDSNLEPVRVDGLRHIGSRRPPR